MFFAPAILRAEDTTEKSKPPVRIYGILWENSVWGDSQTDLLNNLSAKSVNAPTHAVEETTGEANDGYFGITVQNTRFGVALDDYKFENGLKVGGKLEIDFWNQNTNQFRPRVRLAYADFGMSGWRVMAGQNWDVFSPIIPATTNMAVMWESGNLGYRRPQFRFTYDFGISDRNGIVVKTAVANPGNWDIITRPGLSTGTPDLQASAGYRQKMDAGDLYAGFSGLLGWRNYVNKHAIWGVSLDLSIPVHKYFTILGEAAFSKGAADYFSNSSSPDDTNAVRPTKTISTWINIVSKWTKWFDTAVGYGIDDPYSDDQATLVNPTSTAPTTNVVRKNQMALAALKFHPVQPLTLALEYEYIRTNYIDSKKGVANVILTSVMYQF